MSARHGRRPAVYLASPALVGVLALLVACGPTVQKAPGLPDRGRAEQHVREATERGEIEVLFDGYYAALARHDFAAACGWLAPATRERFIRNLRRAGGRASSCRRGLSARDARGRLLLDRYAPAFRRAKITRITIAGDRATIEWRAPYRGRQLQPSQSARKVQGEWRLTEILG